MSDIIWTTAQLRLGDLVEWEHNPVTLSKHDAAEIKKSIDKFGLVLPLVANAPLEGGVRRLIDGHQRKAIMLMAKQAGKDTMVDVRVPSRPLEERECDELSIRLRRNVGEWSWDLLANTFDMPDLLEWGFEKDELLGKGFDMGEGEAPEAKIDKAAELQEKWQVALGDIWEVGRHRIACGDCTDKATVDALMMGEKADTIITDPPYNVDKAIWDTDVLPVLNRAASVVSNFLAHNGICFWFTATRYIPQVIEATSILPYKWMFIWYPSNNMAHGDLGFQKFTAALVLGREKVWRENMQDLREYPIIISKEDPGHPIPKPIELIEYLVEMASRNIVLDPFLGSGTTLVACQRLGRIGRGIEIAPQYVAVALERLSDMGLAPALIDKQGSVSPVGN